jgi:hypothetical protein
MTLSQGQHSLELGIFRVAQTLGGGEGRSRGTEQAAHPAEMREQVAGKVDRRTARHAGTQKNRQQFGVRKGFGPLFQ